MRIEKRIAVLDTSVVVAGIFWKSDAYRCLAALARRRFFAVASQSLIAEYRRVAARLQAEQESDRNPRPVLDWLETTARKVELWPLADPVSRDAGDDVFIATALAAKASFVVTHDPDLLILEKPFGIEMIRPREFLRRISKT